MDYKEKDFIQLLNQNQKIIHKVCNLYMNWQEDKEDLFQEITLQAWKAYSQFRGEAKFSTWLYRVALNTAITFFRKDKKNAFIDTVSEMPELTVPMDRDPIEDKTKAMYEAIAALSKIDKAIVMLYLEDYSYAEISEIIGITANNIAVKMNRIKVKLREATLKNFERI
ncbi:MAG TPA: RNA polymerase sigma factor [Sediminibacterium sp.]|jgi:RNA polymerase sigma-70 factor (ECF subfamily)|uniref:RNA polymerase sigma factor n=1 Tax=Sediminibacterium sp. TaxID=1917865 RepID=UPI0008B8CDD9|nr:RNA polymerase sigma factor [Sediminibacterium sp.]OHC85297.1 MAG: RNA polymerase subunit sigma-70 [Sphingobacteriia bacterium RIFOXYC2_FULL_35_18]OHC89466.1 MAG: RNA polymerase subunit sigma-70 [Sphingobacteriia bacterium RIFOXYD2_FULL_35_12]OYY13886.1 MAG: RNA polymerase subunit sigma-70 [Sphingobacteriia bacterium 35-40-8]OYZ53561.1 MAG: RNA polymerase subunit sigma-70 [Sphingobacteriia bacterium 24-36-13]OZA64298.1 MAG: RNA polymerase subunit sigma-70 [Sphingobacteriia bacterium 39-36-1